MAMDKNDKLNLFRKVPKVGDDYIVEPLERLAYLDQQLFERKKVLYRFVTDVEKYKHLADQEDTVAISIAEQNTPEAIAQIKGLKLDIDSYDKIRKDLVKAIGKAEVDQFYNGQRSTGYPIPAEWLKQNS